MLRFTIRDLLWLMVVVGLGVGWSVDHKVTEPVRKIDWELNNLRTLIEKEGYTVTINEKGVGIFHRGMELRGGPFRYRDGHVYDPERRRDASID